MLETYRSAVRRGRETLAERDSGRGTGCYDPSASTE
jgi:hypothetical protein